MKKKFCISKMLGIGFLSMTTIFGGALISMHNVFAAGGDGEDGDTQETSHAMAEHTLNTRIVLPSIDEIFTDANIDLIMDQPLSIQSFLDEFSVPTGQTGDGEQNTSDIQFSVPNIQLPVPDIQLPADAFNFQMGKKKNQEKHRPPKSVFVKDLTANGEKVKMTICHFGEMYGFLHPRRKGNEITFAKAFGIKVAKVATKYLELPLPTRDEQRAAILMYNRLGSGPCYNKFINIMYNDKDFRKNCALACAKDNFVMEKLKFTPADRSQLIERISQM